MSEAIKFGQSDILVHSTNIFDQSTTSHTQCIPVSVALYSYIKMQTTQPHAINNTVHLTSPVIYAPVQDFNLN